MEPQKKVRCAIYTRKSTDEGLEKEFNTLEAQREAGENYIKSFKHQGWEALPDHYDDGGFSGGNLKRPALQQLLKDVEKGKVDMIVVYKIDRLTRSLLDFAQLVKTLEKHNCSFVSVTQHFNTCDSMGKLTLNILLSFAQFERELGAERVRDKIAASRKKGMWTGGSVPLGYTLKNKKLIIEPAEAEIIRFIFEDYARTRSELLTTQHAIERGYTPKERKNKDGTLKNKEVFNHSMVNHILNNPLYLGKMPYKGELYEGQHKAIISQDLWDRVKSLKSDNLGNAFCPSRSVKNSLLKGLLECECCGTMIPTRCKRGNKYYEYYTTLKSVKEGAKAHPCKIESVPAGELDTFVLEKIQQIFKSPKIMREMAKQLEEANPKYSANDAYNLANNIGEVFQYFEPATIHDFISEVVEKVVLHQEFIEIKLRPYGADIFENQLTEPDKCYCKESLVLKYPVKFGRKRGSMKIVEPTNPTKDMPARDEKLYNAVTQAFYLKNEMETKKISLAELSRREHCDHTYIGQVVRLTTLAPDIIMAIIEGRQPKLLTLRRLLRERLPYSWEEQRKELGFNPA